jgi:hypothetical protein
MDAVDMGMASRLQHPYISHTSAKYQPTSKNMIQPSYLGGHETIVFVIILRRGTGFRTGYK